MSTVDSNIIHESATVVLLRDSSDGFEVLLLKKNAALNYGGTWVFPGGLVESEDHALAQQHFGSDSRTDIALTACLRETREETGLSLNAEQLTPFANWLTPNLKIKRYNTLFFIAPLEHGPQSNAIQIDGEEIVDYQWISAAEALEQQSQQRMLLNGPSFVTLSHLTKHASSEDAIAAMTTQGIQWYEPRGAKTDNGVVTLYHGDRLYQADVLSEDALMKSDNPRHRLYMHSNKPWEYEDTR